MLVALTPQATEQQYLGTLIAYKAADVKILATMVH